MVSEIIHKEVDSAGYGARGKQKDALFDLESLEAGLGHLCTMLAAACLRDYNSDVDYRGVSVSCGCGSEAV